jgi:hypothetical protein
MTHEEELKAARPSMLNDLHRRSHWVASCPGTAWWAGEYGVIHGGLGVCQPIPLRVYVGIEVIPTKGDGTIAVKSGDEREDPWHYTWAPNRDGGEYGFQPFDLFKTENVLEERRFAISKLMSELHTTAGMDCTYKVRTVSELIYGSGANWSGAFSSALVVATLLASGRIDSNTLSSWRETPVERLKKDPSFDLCNRLAWKMESAINGLVTSGYGSFCALVGGQHPIIYRQLSSKNESVKGLLQLNPDTVDGLDYWGSTIPERFDEPRNSDMIGIYCGLIYTGEAKPPTGQRLELASSSFPSHKEITKKLSEILPQEAMQALGTVESVTNSDGFQQGEPGPVKLGMHDPQGYWDTIDVIKEMAILVAHGLGSTYEGTNPGDMRRVVVAMRRVNSCLEALNSDWPQAREMEGHFYGRVRRLNELYPGIYLESAIKISGGGGGGSLFFVAPLSLELIKELEALVLVARNSLGIRACIQWSNAYSISDVDGRPMPNEDAEGVRPSRGALILDNQLVALPTPEDATSSSLSHTHRINRILQSEG